MSKRDDLPKNKLLKWPKIKANKFAKTLVAKLSEPLKNKLHKPLGGSSLGKHGWKFLTKGFTYMKENGRELEKF